jgi:hypothetical protein
MSQVANPSRRHDAGDDPMAARVESVLEPVVGQERNWR